jgi:hypothetical protein
MAMKCMVAKHQGISLLLFLVYWLVDWLLGQMDVCENITKMFIFK